MTLTAWRLTFRLHRFEVFALAVFGLLLTGLALLVAARLDSIGFTGVCIDRTGTRPIPAFCEPLGQLFYNRANNEAAPVQSFIVIVPYIAAILLGVAIVAARSSAAPRDWRGRWRRRGGRGSSPASSRSRSWSRSSRSCSGSRQIASWARRCPTSTWPTPSPTSAYAGSSSPRG